MKIEDRSMLMRLKSQTSRAPFDDLVSEILENSSEIDPNITSYIASVFKTFDYVCPRLAVDFAIKSGDKAFYSHIRASHVRGNTEALIALLEASIPDEMIETRLSEILYERFKAKDWVWTIQILEALSANGSMKCLDTLEVLQYDFAAEVYVAKIKSCVNPETQIKPGEEGWNFYTYVDQVTDEVLLKVSRLLGEAIDQIRQRNCELDYLWFN